MARPLPPLAQRPSALAAFSSARRHWLARAAAGSAALAAGAWLQPVSAAQPARQGVARITGEATVNGKPMRAGMRLAAGDTVRTGPRAELVALVGRDAWLVRGESEIELAGSTGGGIPRLLRLASGALLAAFAPGETKEIRTATASIGIRGTAVYVEAEAGRTYVCTCYGAARLTPLDEPAAAETVRTRHHDQPRYIHPMGMPRRIEHAPVVNHTDAELVMLETLAGRKVPFPVTRY